MPVKVIGSYSAFSNVAILGWDNSSVQYTPEKERADQREREREGQYLASLAVEGGAETRMEGGR
jgi:hypothetical protein